MFQDEENDVVEGTSEVEMEEMLYTLVRRANGVVRVMTYEEGGIMTHNKGLVISLKDGSEFQITIVSS